MQAQVPGGSSLTVVGDSQICVYLLLPQRCSRWVGARPQQSQGLHSALALGAGAKTVSGKEETGWEQLSWDSH